jgi:hypothetical protein
MSAADQQVGNSIDRHAYHEPGLVIEETKSYNNFRKKKASESQESSRNPNHTNYSVGHSIISSSKLKNAGNMISNRDGSPIRNNKMPSIKNYNVNNSNNLVSLNTE